jgi:DNA-binding CsgD family transcriptional regulator
MGLASYGEPKYINQFKQIIYYDENDYFNLNLDYFCHHNNSNFTYSFPDGIPKFPNLYSDKMIELFGPERKKNDEIRTKHFDIASSLQKTFENIVFSILNKLHSDLNIDNLCLAGGCALNSKFNGLIKQKTKFKNIFIQPNAGDAGGSMGSALYFLKNNKKTNNKQYYNEKNKCYLGSEYSNDFIESLQWALLLYVERNLWPEQRPPESAQNAPKYLPQLNHKDLTNRQNQIVMLVLQDSSNCEIANQLHISQSLVKMDLGKVFKILGITHRKELHDTPFFNNWEERLPRDSVLS